MSPLLLGRVFGAALGLSSDQEETQDQQAPGETEEDSGNSDQDQNTEMGIFPKEAKANILYGFFALIVLAVSVVTFKLL